MAKNSLSSPPQQQAPVISPAFSDDALALLFVDRHADELRYVAEWGKWFRYDGKRWAEDKTVHIFDLVRQVCREAAATTNNITEAKATSSASKVAAVERLARADRCVAATIGQWDVDPWLLNTPDGVVDLRNGKMRGHRITDYMLKITAVSPGGNCPQFKEFLHRIFANNVEMMKYMQRVFGYALTGSIREQVLFFWYGTGNNGKGVLTNTVRGIMASYHQTAAMTTFVSTKGNEQHPTDLAMLHGARLVTSTEVEEGSRWSEAKIKTLTGGDEIQARFMRQDFFKFVPVFKLMVSGNHKPMLRSVNVAIKRRMNLLPFTVTIPPNEVDPNLAENLEEEWPGILAWMIRGCLSWQHAGLAPPAAVIDATENYLANEDKVGQFISETCDIDPNGKVRSADLFNDWKDWSDENNCFTGSSQLFADWMGDRQYPKRHTDKGSYFFGLKYKPLPANAADRTGGQRKDAAKATRFE